MMAAASFQDRTDEFRACVSSIRSRSTKGVGSSNVSNQNARNKYDTQAAGTGQPMLKSEFALAASEIGHGISDCGAKLQKLTQLAKRKTLFDDRPVEITELTYIIKQDIAALNTKITDLRNKIKQSKPRGQARQVNEHNENVVASLQTKLADTSMSFKDVLEIRTQNMKAAKSREAQFTSKSTHQGPRNTSSPLYLDRPSSAARADQETHDPEEIMLDMESQPNSQYQQMELVEQQNNYIGERGMAIESIERTIGELGGMFNQLMQMVAEQRETVQRIDYNTEDISTNVSGAQRELLKYYARVTSNRWLMLKMFGVLIIFFLLFVLLS